jgi:hypothetical protein
MVLVEVRVVPAVQVAPAVVRVVPAVQVAPAVVPEIRVVPGVALALVGEESRQVAKVNPVATNLMQENPAVMMPMRIKTRQTNQGRKIPPIFN